MVVLWELVGEVEDDVGEEVCFGDVQQEMQDIEGYGVVGEYYCC